MRLPGIEKAEVSETKIVKYLLSATHRAGKSKATFFSAHGFDPQRWKDLDTALRQHAADNEVARQEKTMFGTRYVVDGGLKAPDGSLLNVRTVWFIDDDGETPRFVTAYPLRRRNS